MKVFDAIMLVLITGFLALFTGASMGDGCGASRVRAEACDAAVKENVPTLVKLHCSESIQAAYLQVVEK